MVIRGDAKAVDVHRSSFFQTENPEWIEQEFQLSWSLCLHFVEGGTEMLIQLHMLTGLKFTAPTGVSGHYNKRESVSDITARRLIS